jgi:phage gp45-like
VTIEHAKGSSIVMKSDGSIAITGKNITIDAGNGNIEMKANNVNVSVQTAMDVK